MIPQIEISEHSSLHTLTASIVIDKTGPSLELKATLTINMERSDPIHVTGLLVGRMQGIDGELSVQHLAISFPAQSHFVHVFS